jgi:hypothetical protein
LPLVVDCLLAQPGRPRDPVRQQLLLAFGHLFAISDTLAGCPYSYRSRICAVRRIIVACYSNDNPSLIAHAEQARVRGAVDQA